MRTRQWILACLLLATAGTSSALAQKISEDQWQRLPEEKKQELRQNYKEWQALAPDRRKAVEENFATYEGLDAEEKARVQENFEDYRNLPPEKQKELRDKYQEFRKLPLSIQKQLQQRGRARYRKSRGTPARRPPSGRRGSNPWPVAE